MKVDFLILGAQKAGSTWVYRNLDTHPDVYCPSEELHFFSNDAEYNKGYSYYHELFDPKDFSRIIGEKTPEYMNVISSYNPKVSLSTHLRVYNYNPNMKFVIVLREPIARLKSAMNHMLRTRRMSPFDNAYDIIFGSKKYKGEAFSLIENGFYYQNLKKYLSQFDPNQFLILFFETDITLHSTETLQRLCSFLEISYSSDYFPDKSEKKNEYKMSKPSLVLNHFFPALRQVNNRLNHIFKPFKLQLDNKVIIQLQEIYSEENENLKKLVGPLPKNWRY